MELNVYKFYKTYGFSTKRGNRTHKILRPIAKLLWKIGVRKII